jgi:hypothetical protein
MAKISHELWVCTSCMLHSQNGECGECKNCSAWPDEVDPEQPLPWALWPEEGSWNMAMGAHEHSDTCTEEDQQEGCDCGRIPQSAMFCSGCGTTIHGARYAFVRFHTSR